MSPRQTWTVPTERLPWQSNAEFEPWEYKEGTDIVGIDADISQAICDKLGYELKIEDMAFETILASVNSGKSRFRRSRNDRYSGA